MLTVRECSERLGLSRSFVYQEIRQGRLRHHLFGRRAIRIDQADLQAYIEEHRSAIGTPHQMNRTPQALKRKQQFKHVTVNRALPHKT
jgi:excisionase family DNA binding protein